MIIINKKPNIDGIVIHISTAKAEDLINALDFYLNDQDANLRDGSYEIVKDIYDKIKDRLR